jgi:hypothetical protein
MKNKLSLYEKWLYLDESNINKVLRDSYLYNKTKFNISWLVFKISFLEEFPIIKNWNIVKQKINNLITKRDIEIRFLFNYIEM